MSKYRRERIRAIADYICLPKHLHEGSSAAAQNGLSLSHAGFNGTWNSSTSAAGASTGNNSASSNENDDDESPLNKSKAFSEVRNVGNGNSSAASLYSDTQNESRWDVVCLQELWCAEDWEYVYQKARTSGSGLKHGRYFWR